jgi:hypothetical protein
VVRKVGVVVVRKVGKVAAEGRHCNSKAKASSRVESKVSKVGVEVGQRDFVRARVLIRRDCQSVRACGQRPQRGLTPHIDGVWRPQLVS